MSKADFLAGEGKYIRSVAITAGVPSEFVKVLGVDEISTRMFKLASRKLLATSFNVKTLVLIPSGQQTSITDQSALNANLVKYGLPSGTLVVQNTSAVTGNTTASSGSQPASAYNIPVGPIVGVSVALGVALLGILLLSGKRSKPAPFTVSPDSPRHGMIASIGTLVIFEHPPHEAVRCFLQHNASFSCPSCPALPAPLRSTILMAAAAGNNVPWQRSLQRRFNLRLVRWRGECRTLR